MRISSAPMCEASGSRVSDTERVHWQESREGKMTINYAEREFWHQASRVQGVGLSSRAGLPARVH